MYNETVILGVVVSILFSELTGLSPAGLIVPGYIALNLHSPQRIVYTLCIAAVSMLLCRLVGRFVILYGRRQFALAILMSFVLSIAVRESGLLPFSTDVIGCLLPGIIAREFDRQGVVKTVLSLAAATGVLVLLLLICGWQALGI